MTANPARRRWLQGAAALATAPWLGAQAADAPAAFAPRPPLPRLDVRPGRIAAITTCTRPFRAAGPRLEAEHVGRQLVVHSYGHGGSGWSLSWGAADAALALLPRGTARIAVIGCGAIGLTTARRAQELGLRVRIYADERAPQAFSAAASGVWSPDSRIATAAAATPAFVQQWQRMARTSWLRWQQMLGLPGDPVAWSDGYALSDMPFDQPLPDDGVPDPEPEFAELERHLDIPRPRSVPLAAHEHPFPVAHARRYTQLTFNLPAYTRMLLADFFAEGGDLVPRHFEHPRQWAGLPERVLVNATGWGAQALLGDASLVPVRGQIARLPAQAGGYGIGWRGHNVNVVSRHDALLVQDFQPSDWNNPDRTPDIARAEAAVQRLAALFA